jgi:hypothetical protein
MDVTFVKKDVKTPPPIVGVDVSKLTDEQVMTLFKNCLAELAKRGYEPQMPKTNKSAADQAGNPVSGYTLDPKSGKSYKVKAPKSKPVSLEKAERAFRIAKANLNNYISTLHIEWDESVARYRWPADRELSQLAVWITFNQVYSLSLLRLRQARGDSTPVAFRRTAYDEKVDKDQLFASVQKRMGADFDAFAKAVEDGHIVEAIVTTPQKGEVKSGQSNETAAQAAKSSA